MRTGLNYKGDLVIELSMHEAILINEILSSSILSGEDDTVRNELHENVANLDDPDFEWRYL